MSWTPCCRSNSSNESTLLFRRLLWTEEITQQSDAAIRQEPCISDSSIFYEPKKQPRCRTTYFTAVRRCCLTGFLITFVFELSPAKSWQAFRTLGSSASNLWSSAVRRGPAPRFKCQKVCILANWLVKGQPISDNETHGGCSLEVLRAAGAYKSCPGDGQRLSPPGMVYEGCSWQLFREQNNAL